MSDNEQNLLAEYRRLHDWLSELCEDSGYRRLNSFPWGGLVEKLVELARLDKRSER